MFFFSVLLIHRDQLENIKIGKVLAETDKGKICFAQTVPTKRAPSSIKRGQSKLFVTFRPSENIKDEVSLTSGHDYKTSTVTAASGKKDILFFLKKVLHGYLMIKKKKFY